MKLFTIYSAIYLIFLFGGGGIVGASDKSDVGERVSVTTRAADIEFSVYFSKIYADAMEVSVNHTVTNTSDHPIRYVIANGVYDRRISLFGPDGKQVAPYPYDMSVMSKRGSKRLAEVFATANA